MSIKNSNHENTLCDKRKIVIDFTHLIDKIYDKIDSNQLQEYLNELIEETPQNKNQIEKTEEMINYATQIIPGLNLLIGSDFEEFKDGVKDGSMVNKINVIINIFKKSLNDETIQNQLQYLIDSATSEIDKQIVSKKRKI